MDDWLLYKMCVEDQWRWANALNTLDDKDVDKAFLRWYTTPDGIAFIYAMFKAGLYKIQPPHMAEIPKDDGTMRIVFVNECTKEHPDRLVLSVMNNLLLDLCKDRMIHPNCVSYLPGIGCGKVDIEAAKALSEWAKNCKEIEYAVKLDLSKYFDSVPLWLIDSTTRKIVENTCDSSVIRTLNIHHHDNRVYDLDKKLITHYKSIAQGNSTAAFFADACLYEMDKRVSEMNVFYRRYSDDILICGPEWRQALTVVEQMLAEREMKLNPKKVEILRKDKWFKFLGFAIKGDKISFSKKRLDNICKEIASRTVNNIERMKKKDYVSALNSVIQYLYGGEYSLMAGLLPIINVKEDVEILNRYIMDCLRAVALGKYNKPSSPGWENRKDKKGVITYHPAGCCGNNFRKMKELPNWESLQKMQNLINTDRQAYKAKVFGMGITKAEYAA